MAFFGLGERAFEGFVAFFVLGEGEVFEGFMAFFGLR